MLKVGVVGASGFIGNRIVETLHAEDPASVFPIVRSINSLSRLTVKGLDYRIAHALHQSSLRQAFEGCDIIIHSILGNPGLIRGSVVSAYQAAEKAGIRRFIYLSSMCVHGQAPALYTTEDSPLSRQQPFPYNTAKIDAEQRLRNLCANGTVEVVIFRPGVVFGPRSSRIIDIARQLLSGTACFINEGKGICNTLYVDNLIHAIRLAMTSEKANGQAFFVGEHEQVTWWDFYRPIAEAIGVDINQVPTVPMPNITASSRKPRLIGSLRSSELIQRMFLPVSAAFKQSSRQVKGDTQKTSDFARRFSSTPVSPSLLKPVMTSEMALLQSSQYKLPFRKAAELLNYDPVISFEDACRQSVDWLTSEWMQSSRKA